MGLTLGRSLNVTLNCLGCFFLERNSFLLERRMRRIGEDREDGEDGEDREDREGAWGEGEKGWPSGWIKAWMDFNH